MKLNNMNSEITNTAEFKANTDRTVFSDSNKIILNTNNLHVILPTFIQNEKQNSNPITAPKRIQSSPAKAQRRFSQDSGMLRNKSVNVRFLFYFFYKKIISTRICIHFFFYSN